MFVSTGVWLLLLAAVIIIYSIFFFGDSKPRHRTVRDRLRTIKISATQLHTTSMAETMEELNQLATNFDRQGDGVRFKMTSELPGGDDAQPLLASYPNNSLWDVLESIALHYHLTYHIDEENYCITFHPTHETPPLLCRRYVLPVERFPHPWTCKDYRAFFVGHGLPFPSTPQGDSYAAYHHEKRELEVQTTENSLNLIEKMFDLDPEVTTETKS